MHHRASALSHRAASVGPMTKVGVALIVLLVAACGGDDTGDGVAISPEVPTSSATAPPPSTAVPTTGAPVTAAGVGGGCADVVEVSIESGQSGFTIAATVRSADTGWDKYADAWQVRSLDGAVLGERVLTHPHETEQPFTRSLRGVEIPPEVAEIVVVARDSVAGFCGVGFTIEVPHP